MQANLPQINSVPATMLMACQRGKGWSSAAAICHQSGDRENCQQRNYDETAMIAPTSCGNAAQDQKRRSTPM